MRSRIFFPCATALPSAADASLGCRLMAGQRILVPSMGVRLPPSQPFALLHMARSSSGLGRRPLKAEITSSNLVRATKRFTRVPQEPGFSFRCLLSIERSIPPMGRNAACSEAGHDCLPGVCLGSRENGPVWKRGVPAGGPLRRVAFIVHEKADRGREATVPAPLQSVSRR